MIRKRRTRPGASVGLPCAAMGTVAVVQAGMTEGDVRGAWNAEPSVPTDDG